jgi:hypothetical protein
MTFKTNLTPLSDLELLDQESLECLRRLNITTVEELVGQLEADPSGLARALRVSRPKLRRIRKRALATLPPAVRDALLVSPDGDFPLGALDPSRSKR